MNEEFRTYLETLEKQAVTPELLERNQGISVLKVFEHMMEDPHIQACFTTRRMAVAARPWSILASGDSAGATKIATFIERTLKAIPNFEHSLSHLLKAVPFGVSVLEIMWRIDPDVVRVDALRTRRHERFAYQNEAFMLIDTEDNNVLKPLPGRKFIDHKHTPFAIPLLYSLYWPWWMKQNLVEAQSATLYDFCNSVITERVLDKVKQLQNPTSYKEAATFNETNNEIVAEDAKALVDTITATLIRWLVDFNYGPDVEAPSFVIDYLPPRGTPEFAQMLKTLSDMGYKVPERFITETFGLPTEKD